MDKKVLLKDETKDESDDELDVDTVEPVAKPCYNPNKVKRESNFYLMLNLKGVGMPSVKKMILVVSNRVARDKLFGVGMTPQ